MSTNKPRVGDETCSSHNEVRILRMSETKVPINHYVNILNTRFSVLFRWTTRSLYSVLLGALSWNTHRCFLVLQQPISTRLAH